MVNTNLLVEVIKKEVGSPGNLGKKIGISKTSIYRRLNGQIEFTRADLEKIKQVLHLSNARFIKIFFEEKVS